jgi:hypothetical protein
MNRRLGDISFLSLLPDSIREDSRIRAAALSLDGLLRKTALAVPNLLLFARLDPAKSGMLPPLARLTEAAGGLKPLSAELLEQLAWQFHVDFRETARTDEELAAMVLNTIPWHRIKGTPAGIRAALDLFGLAAEIEEDGRDDYWASYQLGLPRIVDLETVRLVCRVAYEMQPARCSLYRIYTDVWDVRPGSYDVGFYDVEAYDYYSGVPVPGLPDDGDLLVSFGRPGTAWSLPRLAAAYAGRLRGRGVVASEEENFRYDLAYYDTTGPQPNQGFVRSRLRLAVFGSPLYRICFWTGPWDGRIWAEIESVGHAREPFFFSRRSIAAIEGVYDDSRYDGLNTCYGQPVYTLADDPARYDDGCYDTHDPGRRRVVVDEMTVRDWNILMDYNGAQGGFAHITRETV